VESCFEGLNCSRKCCGSEVQTISEDKSTLVLSFDNLNYRVECLKRGRTIEINKAKLKKYIGKTYGCNKTMTKILIVLFYYYSEIKGKYIL
jgi:exosome complex RNA-binding protein Rrp4